MLLTGETVSPSYVRANHVGLISFVFVIGPTERAVLASYTMAVVASLHDQCTEGQTPSVNKSQNFDLATSQGPHWPIYLRKNN